MNTEIKKPGPKPKSDGVKSDKMLIPLSTKYKKWILELASEKNISASELFRSSVESKFCNEFKKFKKDNGIDS